MCQKNLKVRDSQVEYWLSHYRNLCFPSSKNIILTQKYCATIDEEENKRHTIYQGRGEIIDKNGVTQEFIVFGFSFEMLARAKTWYIDGTFKLAPRSYYQLMTIIRSN